MFRKLRKWFGKKTVREFLYGRPNERTSTSQLPISPYSRPFPSVPWSTVGSNPDMTPPPGVDPRVIFPILKRLRDFVPDVSAGVWAWVRLCSTPLSYNVIGGGEETQARAKAILEQLDRRIYGVQNERERGIDSLIQSFFLSVFTYGAFCGEVVLDNDRGRIDRFVIIDPATVRFKMNANTRVFHPYQIQADGSHVKLNPSSFFYYGLDADGLTPYGRSPLLALPFVIRMQQQLLSDMTKAQHNAGYPTIHFRVVKPERESREGSSDYNQRLANEMEQIQSAIDRKEADSNLITFDNVEVQYVGPSGHAQQWSESIQAIGEQVISALHLAPFMIGRNWGTTQSWGTAQYQLLTNNARTVQEGAKRLAGWLRNLELILCGIPLSVEHKFAPHHHLDAFDRARAFQTSAETLMALTEKGLVHPDTTKQRIETLFQFLS